MSNPLVGRFDARGGEIGRSEDAMPESAVEGEALWRGFQNGVGIDLPAPNGPSPGLFSAIGAMLRIAVGGIHREMGGPGALRPAAPTVG